VAFRFWLKLGMISFGGPAGQIAILHTELVDRRRWIAEGPFLHALNFCMLLPGPEAQQLVTYIGWRMHGLAGAVSAGSLFVLPGAVVMVGLAWIAAAHGDWAPVAAVFYGIKPVVVAIIAHAVWRIGRRALTGAVPVALAVLAFIGIYVLELPFPLIVLAAALVGLVASRLARNPFARPEGADEPDDMAAAGESRRGLARLARLLTVFVLLWIVPVGALVLALGAEPYGDVATFFTKAAFVTFGGAYAVLPYVADAAVEHYGWLSAADMTNGLALAESTPGPLILVTQFVGFFAGWTSGSGALAQIPAAVVAAAMTTYVTFLPCFLFILAGAPYIERLYGNRLAVSALGAITAAVVGVVANLGVFLAQIVFVPQGSVDAIAVALAALGAAVLFLKPVPVHWLVLAGALAGLALWSAGLPIAG
jgi:chromate transporter